MDDTAVPSAATPTSAAVVGCGVIGAGWAARMRLAGIDVHAFDPSPAARRILDEVFGNAVAAWADLDIVVESPGSLTLHDSVELAVADQAWIQESVPENPATKRATYEGIEASAPIDALIASSTSGIKATDLQQGMQHPERLVVAHPFNPVYFLPLVEICAGEATTEEVSERAMAWYRSIAMYPLRIRVEIDAFIADRLLEAVWRESLWLVHDGVATTEEIDDAIRYGFGLRWAQMGLFETYRIAGGEGGMAHFIGQFGEALSWPWTKLMDTPELDDALVAKIAAQSDAQSGDYDLRELERIRDRNLATILAGLEANDWGAGKVVKLMRGFEHRSDRARPDPTQPNARR
ncbi:MAG: hypothetical protein GY708_13305 [Actinomycetia bacterium]|nr:hypothetical protein [Actinomycetes bacterium]MCP4963279.1 hypothetical protein [Actinomycetes bacterium]